MAAALQVAAVAAVRPAAMPEAARVA